MAGGAVAMLASVLTIGATLDLWHSFGWTTPVRHEADVMAIRSDISDVAMGLEAVQELRDELRCDRLEKELVKLLQDQRNGDDSVQTQERISTIRRLRGSQRLNCDRFDDY